jgi:hypothetical protein
VSDRRNVQRALRLRQHGAIGVGTSAREQFNEHAGNAFSTSAVAALPLLGVILTSITLKFRALASPKVR